MQTDNLFHDLLKSSDREKLLLLNNYLSDSDIYNNITIPNGRTAKSWRVIDVRHSDEESLIAEVLIDCSKEAEGGYLDSEGNSYEIDEFRFSVEASISQKGVIWEEDINVFLFRSSRNTNLLESGRVGVGWCDFDLSQPLNEIYSEMDKHNWARGNHRSQIKRFKEIKKGDLLIVPDAGVCYIGEANGEYFYNPSQEHYGQNASNQIGVDFWKNYDEKLLTFSRDSFSKGFQKRLKIRQTISTLSEFLEELTTLKASLPTIIGEKKWANLNSSWLEEFRRKGLDEYSKLPAQILCTSILMARNLGLKGLDGKVTLEEFLNSHEDYKEILGWDKKEPTQDNAPEIVEVIFAKCCSLILEKGIEDAVKYYQFLHDHTFCNRDLGMVKMTPFIPTEIYDLALTLLGEENISIRTEAAIPSTPIERILENRSLSLASYNDSVNQATAMLALVLDRASSINCISPAEFYVSKDESIISFPPIGSKVDRSLDHSFFDGMIPRDQLELQIAQFIEHAQEGQKAIFITPNSFLWEASRNLQLIRKMIIEGNLLKTVIQLPLNIFANTSILTSLIFLEKSDNGNVSFLDAQHAYIKKSLRNSKINVEVIRKLLKSESAEKNLKIPREKIVEKNFSFYLADYLKPALEDLPPNHQFIELGQLVTLLSGASLTLTGSYKEAHHRNFDSGTKLVSQNFMEFEDFDLDEHADRLKNYKSVDEPCLLVSPIYNSGLKVAFYEPEATHKIVVHRDIFLLKITSPLISSKWLMNQLCLPSSEKRFQSLLRGSGLKRFNSSGFLKLQIPVPDLKLAESEVIKIQESTVRLARAERLRSLIANEGLEAQIEELKEKHKIQLGHRLHTIGNTLEKLSVSLELLEEDVSQLQGATVEKAKSRFGKINQWIAKLENQCDSLDRVNDETSGKVNIHEGLKNWHDSQPQAGYQIEIIYENSEEEKAPFIVPLSQTQLEDILDNILRNAEVHGGIKNNDKDYKFLITYQFSQGSTNNEILLTAQNNGLPLPKNLDSSLFCSGVPAGKTGNKGRGGATINDIITSVGGKVELANSEGSEYPVSITISIPITLD